MGLESGRKSGAAAKFSSSGTARQRVPWDVGVDGGGVGGGAAVRPKKAIAAAAIPVLGRLCPAPWML